MHSTYHSKKHEKVEGLPEIEEKSEECAVMEARGGACFKDWLKLNNGQEQKPPTEFKQQGGSVGKFCKVLVNVRIDAYL